jgi:hypothetical protein
MMRSTGNPPLLLGRSALQLCPLLGLYWRRRPEEVEAMSCWCGHGPWHYHGYPYPPPYLPPQYPPSAYYQPEELDERPVRRRRRRRARDPEELEDYLQDLQEEIDRVRQELTALREAGETES